MTAFLIRRLALLLPTFLGNHRVTAGTLAPVLPKFAVEVQAHVLTSGSRHLPRRVTLVRDFLVTALNHECSKH